MNGELDCLVKKLDQWLLWYGPLESESRPNMSLTQNKVKPIAG